MIEGLSEKIKKIRVLILDVDGILTHGQIVLDHEGRETKFFNVQDGFGVVLIRRAGIKTVIISARSSKAVEARANDLQFDQVFQDARPKAGPYAKVLKEFGVSDENVCFMGDDLPDLFILRKAGLAVTVPNGAEECKKAAHYVTKKEGGHGAVREVVEMILKGQGKWDDLVRSYS